MLFDDTYNTIASNAEGIFQERGSKFIAYAYPLISEEQVKIFVNTLRIEHPKARHFCWALRLSKDRSNFRFQDDGEPSGTAGRPILNSLLSANLTNILIIVVRYFGGTLLGVPGLINAYKSASLDVISAAQVIEKTLNDVYEVTFLYLGINDVMRIIKDEQLEILSQNFDNECCMQLSIRKSSLNTVLGRLETIEQLNLKYLHTA
ncbi:MAG: YigZ family protein [Pedobacter sp.]|uniref:IMPACT family protein n=1 Tax=Pedobacter sp. JCM 36344 TaxID=3374280 RepID=UPI00199945FE|nr:YigZ family protein [Pedobacter sp.]